MSLRKPNRHRPSEFDDGLGDMLAQTLHRHTGPVSPPENGWARIERALRAPTIRPARRSWTALPLPALQVALMILLIVIGGIELQRAALSDDDRPLLTATLPPAEGERFVDEYAVSPGDALLPSGSIRAADPIRFNRSDLPEGVRELRLMKDYLRRQQRQANSKNYPLAMAPSDVAPHPLSPAGRLLYAEPDEPHPPFIGNDPLPGVSAGLIQ